VVWMMCGCSTLRGGPLRYVIETLSPVHCPQTGLVLRSGEKLAAGISIWETDTNAETKDLRVARDVEMGCCLGQTIRNLEGGRVGMARFKLGRRSTVDTGGGDAEVDRPAAVTSSKLGR